MLTLIIVALILMFVAPRLAAFLIVIGLVGLGILVVLSGGAILVALGLLVAL